MQPRAAARVGLAVIAGMVLMFGAWWFLAHMSLGSYTLRATFEDTKGLLPQTPVRMNGVSIGNVSSVDLRPQDLRPVVTLRVHARHRIPRDARIRITSGLLIASPQLEIYWMGEPSHEAMAPGDWPADQVDLRPASGLAQISPEAERTIAAMNVAVGETTRLLQDVAPGLVALLDQMRSVVEKADTTAGNLAEASSGVRRLATDPKLQAALRASLEDFEHMSEEARQTAQTLSGELQAMVTRNSTRLDELLLGALELLRNFTDTVDAARGIMTRLTEQVSDPRIQQSMLETLELGKTTMARFSQIAADIHSLTGDPAVQTDLRTTVGSLRETSDEGQRLVRRLGALAEGIRLPGTGAPLGITDARVTLDFMARSNPPTFRSDIGLRARLGERTALNVGLYDFTEGNRLTAQYETTVAPDVWMRYGIRASKLGVGLDWRMSPTATLSLDAFDPNRSRLDARATLRVNDDLSAFLGVDSLFRQSTPVFGVRVTR